MTISESYAKLGLSQNASVEDIKKAFRKLAHIYHPDKIGGNIERFKEINEAQLIAIKDSETRKIEGSVNPNDPSEGPIGGFSVNVGGIHVVIRPRGQGWNFRNGYYDSNGKFHWL